MGCCKKTEFFSAFLDRVSQNASAQNGARKNMSPSCTFSSAPHILRMGGKLFLHFARECLFSAQESRIPALFLRKSPAARALGASYAGNHYFAIKARQTCTSRASIYPFFYENSIDFGFF